MNHTLVRRRNALFTALLATLPMSFVSQAKMQEQDAPRQPSLTAVPMPLPQKMPTLGCCRCLAGENTLDVSTIPSNPWRVNGQPTAVVAWPNPGWSPNTNSAKWISINAAADGGVNASYRYTLQFKVEKCTILRTIVLKGIAVAADDDYNVYLSGPGGNSSIVPCPSAAAATGRCFTSVPGQLNKFAAWPVTVPGIYTLSEKVEFMRLAALKTNASLEYKPTRGSVTGGRRGLTQRSAVNSEGTFAPPYADLGAFVTETHITETHIW